MSRIFLILILLICTIGKGQVIPDTNSVKPGYEIKFQIKPLKNKLLYLGHYFGDEFPIVDSASVDSQSVVVFKGQNKLAEGIYIVFDPEQSGLFDFLLNSQQHFSVKADMTNPEKIKINFEQSDENTILRKYLDFVAIEGDKYGAFQQKMMTSTNKKDSLKFAKRLTDINESIINMREKFIKENTDKLISTMFIAMRKPHLPDSLLVQKNSKDSAAAKKYIKDHYWDGINFYDGRLTYTQFFGPKIDRYFGETLEYQSDSSIAKIDWMMSYAVANETMTHFLLSRLLFGSMNHRYKWGDEVLAHLFEKYVAPKTYKWLSEEERTRISERAYFVMGKMISKPAPDIDLPTPDGKRQTLYSLKANYTVVCFWDPTCSHCRETLPQIDSIYRAKWSEKGVKIFAVASESDGTIKDWTTYISDHKLQDWTNVYNSIIDDSKRVQSGKMGYSQMYDVWYSPSFFVLDKDKNFVAKKLPYKNMVELVNSLLTQK